MYQARLEELRREVRKGLDQLDRGEARDLDVRSLKRPVRKEVARKTARPAT